MAFKSFSGNSFKITIYVVRFYKFVNWNTNTDTDITQRLLHLCNYSHKTSDDCTAYFLMWQRVTIYQDDQIHFQPVSNNIWQFVRGKTQRAFLDQLQPNALGQE